MAATVVILELYFEFLHLTERPTDSKLNRVLDWLLELYPGDKPPVVCSTDRSKAVVLVLFLLFVALWFPHCFLCFS